jgi:VWFA-related protein
MKNSSRFQVGLFSGMLLTCASALTAFAGPQSLVPSGIVVAEQPAAEGIASIGDANDDTRYSQGTRAIQENRWSDAESIFDEVAQHHGEHAEGALYWKAYAENKQGKNDHALKACAELRQSYPKSRWVDDCGALEIEIRGKSGHPVEPQSEQDENLKLLALKALMQQNEARALPQIQQILSSDQPETFKEHALFVLAQSGSNPAQKILADVAHPPADASATIKSNRALQQRAQQLIAAIHNAQSGAMHAGLNRRIGLDVVVTDASGKAVPGLESQDFTLEDDDQPQKILSFHGAKADPPAEVLILIDTVNTSLTDVAYERQQIDIFLRQNGGQLANPVSILIFNGDGARRLTPSSRDGNALAAALDKTAANLHPIRRSQAFYGAVERLQLSLGTLASLAVEEQTRPGRKVLLWLSPGWPLLVGTNAWPTAKQSETMFEAVVAMSSALREARITLYSIQPARGAGVDSIEWDRYKEYLKPVIKANSANAANVSLQVLAQQSGGRAMTHTVDYLSGEMNACLANIDSYYFLSFDTPPAGHKDEYHALKITVNKPGLTVRTRSGYYDEP